jgi:hypothetical protein
MAQIKDHVAFYPDRVDEIRALPRMEPSYSAKGFHGI